jgi:hypothetical protein
MDEYGEIQFVERNATISGGDPRHQQGRPGGRTFIAQPQNRYGQPQQMIYAQAPGLGVGVGGSSVFGRLTTGQVIDMVAQIFAALMPLPAQPVATSDTSTDVGNLILFQGSLAQYAKRDEQIRTLGNLVTKLVG